MRRRSEASIERGFVTAMRKRGITTIKLTSPGMVGVPDRIVILPRGRVVFIEFKASDGRLQPTQQYWVEKLVALGHRAAVCRSVESATAVVEDELCDENR